MKNDTIELLMERNFFYQIIDTSVFKSCENYSLTCLPQRNCQFPHRYPALRVCQSHILSLKLLLSTFILVCLFINLQQSYFTVCCCCCCCLFDTNYIASSDWFYTLDELEYCFYVYSKVATLTLSMTDRESTLQTQRTTFYITNKDSLNKQKKRTN